MPGIFVGGAFLLSIFITIISAARTPKIPNFDRLAKKHVQACQEAKLSNDDCLRQGLAKLDWHTSPSIVAKVEAR